MKIAKTPIARYLPEDIDFCLRVQAWCKKNRVDYIGDYLIAPVFYNMMEEFLSNDIHVEDICELDVSRVRNIINYWQGRILNKLMKSPKNVSDFMTDEIADLAQALKETGVIRFSNRKEEGR